MILTIFGPNTVMTVDMFLLEFFDFFFADKEPLMEIKDKLYEILKDKQNYILDLLNEEDFNIVLKAFELQNIKP